MANEILPSINDTQRRDRRFANMYEISYNATT